MGWMQYYLEIGMLQHPTISSSPIFGGWIQGGTGSPPVRACWLERHFRGLRCMLSRNGLWGFGTVNVPGTPAVACHLTTHALDGPIHLPSQRVPSNPSWLCSDGKKKPISQPMRPTSEWECRDSDARCAVHGVSDAVHSLQTSVETLVWKSRRKIKWWVMLLLTF